MNRLTGKAIYVVHFDDKVEQAYEQLKKGRSEERQLLKYIERAVDDLKSDPYCGTLIPQNLIPRYYMKRFGGPENLWKYDLPNGWRLIYMIAANEVKILAVLLEWMDHKNYEKRFGYKVR